MALRSEAPVAGRHVFWQKPTADRAEGQPRVAAPQRSGRGSGDRDETAAFQPLERLLAGLTAGDTDPLALDGDDKPVVVNETDGRDAADDIAGPVDAVHRAAGHEDAQAAVRRPDEVALEQRCRAGRRRLADERCEWLARAADEGSDEGQAHEDVQSPEGPSACRSHGGMVARWPSAILGPMSGDPPRSVDAVVIGAGQAGLIVSWHLQRAGRDHVVLERRATLGGSWQDRWDAFTLVSPNWLSGLPGYPYDGDDPDGYMGRDAIVAWTARYAGVIGAPVHLSVDVMRVVRDDADGRRFRVDTTAGPIAADEVVVATGAFQGPRIPDMATGFSPGIAQIHAQDYRSPDQLRPGGILVVGSGQTGCQLAEELLAAGRDVVLATGRCGRYPRRYRGHDVFWWMRQLAEQGEEVGAPLPRVDQLSTPTARFACNAHVSGQSGGHDTNLRRMGRDGIRLTGRLIAADGDVARFAPDLAKNLDFADRFFDEQLGRICERYAQLTGMRLDSDDRAWPSFDPPEVDAIDLSAEGIGTVLWTTGFTRDYAWLDVPLDAFGMPQHERGISGTPGLSFLGMLWQKNNGSANLVGVHLDAAYLASRW
jgi:putative flavoprotein involved in K+ transport